jgi:predicted N-acetyltransferase YhbS
MHAVINMNTTIRQEQAKDIDTITRLTQSAFRDQSNSSHTEEYIVNALRRSNQLTISLVAVEHDFIVGHVAISPITISSGMASWYGLGPVSVLPDHQRQGIGSKLIRAALAELQRLGGQGCVVLGNPSYYGRFGFKPTSYLDLPGVPSQYFQALLLAGELPRGTVCYDQAFDAKE